MKCFLFSTGSYDKCITLFDIEQLYGESLAAKADLLNVGEKIYLPAEGAYIERLEDC